MEPVSEMPGQSKDVRPPAASAWRHLVVAACGVLAVLALWSTIWFYVAGTLKQDIERWAESRRAAGWSVRWTTLTVGGFPFTWDAAFGRPAVTRTGTATPWFWRGPEAVTLRYRPWSPRTFDLTAPGSHRLGPDAAAPGTTVTVAASDVDGRLELAADGRPRTLSLAVDDATIAGVTASPTHVAQLRAILGAVEPFDPSVPPDQRPTARLEAGIAGLELPADTSPPLGRTVGRAELTATLMGVLPPVAPGGVPADALVRWRDDGGTVEIQHLALGWGPLSLMATGTLALDEGLQPQGALNARVAGYGETVDALQRAGMVKPRAAFIAKLALGAIAKTPANGGPPQIAVPVTIQDGRLYVGPAALLPVPRIDWSVK